MAKAIALATGLKFQLSQPVAQSRRPAHATPPACASRPPVARAGLSSGGRQESSRTLVFVGGKTQCVF